MKALPFVIASLLLAAAGPLAAQSYPERPIRIVVPFPPGGGSDISARSVADPISRALKHPVVIDNRPGGQTVIGSELVARSAPDGYTLLLCTDDTTSIHAAYGTKLPYDPVRDFAAVSGIGQASLVLLANAGLGVKTLAELVARARANPGKLSFGSLGTGSPHFLFFEGFKLAAGIQLLDVPYKGTAQAVTDLIGGQVDLMVVGASTAKRHEESGRGVVLAATGDTRNPFAPSVPTFIESGYPGMTMLSGFALCGPAGLPRPVINRLHGEVVTALKDPAVAARLAGIGLVPWPAPPEDFDASVRRTTEIYRRTIQATGAKMEGR